MIRFHPKEGSRTRIGGQRTRSRGRRTRSRRAPLLTGLTLALLATPGLSWAQTQPTLTWRGDIRARLLGREPVHEEWDHWISMRTRLGLEGRFEEGVGFFIQVQDVRYWGEEASTRDPSAGALDVHQAYLEVESFPGAGGTVRGGRQEVHMAEGRLIASPRWGQTGQSFDGVRWTRPFGEGHLDIVYFRIREGSSQQHETSADLTAAWLALPSTALGSVDLLAVHDRSTEPEGTGQSTVGSVWKRSAGPLFFRAQGMYQFGERAGIDVSAFMMAAAGTVSLAEGNGSITLWYDHLSGDSRVGDGENGAFATLYGARHRFYGRGDYFKNIPEDTGGLGLRDAALKLALTPTPLLSANLDVHRLRTARRGTLSSRHLADEVDLWLRYRFREIMSLEAGYSVTWAGTAMEELGRLEGTGNMAYFMTSLSF